MKNKLRFLLILLWVTGLFSFPQQARADVAPPINPPGTNVEPGSKTTQVRMLAEKVVLDVMDDGQPQGLGTAHVTADFVMTNLGSEVESMRVRFPISANDGRGEYPEITGVVVKVDGKIVPTSTTSYDDPKSSSGLIPWVEFGVTFPSSTDVAITVEYNLKGSGYYPYTAFYYVLETGAGWKGTIGRAEIVLRLPYEANSMNVVQDFQIGWAETNRGASFDGNEVHWLYQDFEPGPYAVVQNMEFALVAPGVWKNVLQAQQAVKANPKDGEAWGRLAMQYKQLFLLAKGYRTDVGGSELFRRAVEAYQQCLQLKPSDAQWHAGYADLLANRAYWEGWSTGPTQDTFQALAEIHTALQLAPNDAKVKEIAQVISWLIPDGMIETDKGYDFPWLTQTPTPHPPTETIAPAFDPHEVAGEYASAWLTLWDGQRAKLQLTLRSDYSATLDKTFQDQTQAVLEQGVWRDDGDGLLRVVMAWPNGDPYTFVFRVSPGQLNAIEYPSYFGDAGMILENPTKIQATVIQSVQPGVMLTQEPTRQPDPSKTATVRPAQLKPATVQPSPTPQNSPAGAKPGLPCGSVGIGPLALLGYVWWRKQKRITKLHRLEFRR